jgi:hypothetical protein
MNAQKILVSSDTPISLEKFNNHLISSSLGSSNYNPLLIKARQYALDEIKMMGSELGLSGITTYKAGAIVEKMNEIFSTTDVTIDVKRQDASIRFHLQDQRIQEIFSQCLL